MPDNHGTHLGRNEPRQHADIELVKYALKSKHVDLPDRDKP